MFSPLVVVIIGAILVTWSYFADDRQEQVVTEAVRCFLDESAGTRIDPGVTCCSIDPLLQEQLISSLASVGVPGRVQCELVVVGGDSPEFGDGTATHRVKLVDQGRTILVLRIILGDEPSPRIIGYHVGQQQQ